MSTQRRHRLEANVLRQARGSPQGLPVSGISPKGECSPKATKVPRSGPGEPRAARRGHP